MRYQKYSIIQVLVPPLYIRFNKATIYKLYLLWAIRILNGMSLHYYIRSICIERKKTSQEIPERPFVGRE